MFLPWRRNWGTGRK